MILLIMLFSLPQLMLGFVYGQESTAFINIENFESTIHLDDNLPQVLFSVNFINFPRDNEISARLVQTSTGAIIHTQILNTNSIPTWNK